MMKKSKFKQGTRFRIFNLFRLAVVLFMGVAGVNGQNQSNNVVAAIQLEKMNVLYVGVDNPIRIAVSGYAPEDIEASIDKGSIVKGDSPGSYIVNLETLGFAVITLRAKGKDIQQFNFRVYKAPTFVLSIGGKTEGEISRHLLLAQKGIGVDYKNQAYHERFEMLGYTVTAGGAEDIKVEGYKFTDEVKEIIRSLKLGQEILFSDIRIKYSDGMIKEMNSITLKIK